MKWWMFFFSSSSKNNLKSRMNDSLADFMPFLRLEQIHNVWWCEAWFSTRYCGLVFNLRPSDCDLPDILHSKRLSHRSWQNQQSFIIWLWKYTDTHIVFLTLASVAARKTNNPGVHIVFSSHCYCSDGRQTIWLQRTTHLAFPEARRALVKAPCVHMHVYIFMI